MTKLGEILDVDLLTRHIENRMVSVQRHPTLPLRIFNYAQKATFEPTWGDGTIDYCRGLIVDDGDNVIARPFKKFHNLNTPSIPETMEENLPSMTPEITKKMDGSLGIFWEYQGERGISTRGSFTSPQAKWATSAYAATGRREAWPSGWTPLFEIIYPENRIVVRYDYSALILIGMVHIETGREAPWHILQHFAEANGRRVTDRVHGSTIRELAERNVENEEGYVATYRIGFRPPVKIKIKMADYVRLHKIVTGMNGRSVWELLYRHKALPDGPDHFNKWLKSWAYRLDVEFTSLYVAARELYCNRPINDNPLSTSYRKICAEYFFRQGRPDLQGVFFAMLDERPNEMIESIIWKMIKPRGDDQSFRTEGE